MMGIITELILCFTLVALYSCHISNKYCSGQRHLAVNHSLDAFHGYVVSISKYTCFTDLRNFVSV
jgi:hypothetical protein